MMMIHVTLCPKRILRTLLVLTIAPKTIQRRMRWKEKPRRRKTQKRERLRQRPRPSQKVKPKRAHQRRHRSRSRLRSLRPKERLNMARQKKPSQRRILVGVIPLCTNIYFMFNCSQFPHLLNAFCAFKHLIDVAEVPPWRQRSQICLGSGLAWKRWEGQGSRWLECIWEKATQIQVSIFFWSRLWHVMAILNPDQAFGSGRSLVS